MQNNMCNFIDYELINIQIVTQRDTPAPCYHNTINELIIMMEKKVQYMYSIGYINPPEGGNVHQKYLSNRLH